MSIDHDLDFVTIVGPPFSDQMLPIEVAKYAIWYGRKRRGPAAEVAAALLNEFPDLREPLTYAYQHREVSPLARQLSTVAGFQAWLNNPEPPCTECGGGKGLGNTPDCPAVAGDRGAQGRAS
jgi:hypothetical protein